jgi:hypothetical protein
MRNGTPHALIAGGTGGIAAAQLAFSVSAIDCIHWEFLVEVYGKAERLSVGSLHMRQQFLA